MVLWGDCVLFQSEKKQFINILEKGIEKEMYALQRIILSNEILQKQLTSSFGAAP